MIGVKLILWAMLLTLQVGILALVPKPPKRHLIILSIALVAGIFGLLQSF
jgi:hypothetical protein